jgi:hypothetical protein
MECNLLHMEWDHESPDCAGAVSPMITAGHSFLHVIHPCNSSIYTREYSTLEGSEPCAIPHRGNNSLKLKPLPLHKCPCRPSSSIHVQSYDRSVLCMLLLAGRYAYSDEEGEECRDLEDTRPLIRPGPLSYVDNWAITVSQDDTKVILRTDSGVYAKAGDGGKRVSRSGSLAP